MSVTTDAASRAPVSAWSAEPAPSASVAIKTGGSFLQAHIVQSKASWQGWPSAKCDVPAERAAAHTQCPLIR